MATNERLGDLDFRECYTDLRPMKDRVKGDKGGVKTVLTIVYDNEAATRLFARRSATIAWQQMQHSLRASDSTYVVPTVAEVIISELAKRERVGFKTTPDSVARKINAFVSIDDYAASLRKLGVNEQEVKRLVAKKMKGAAV